MAQFLCLLLRHHRWSALQGMVSLSLKSTPAVLDTVLLTMALKSDLYTWQRYGHKQRHVGVAAGVVLLDLHGLHVNEALKILGREIGQLQEGGQGKGRLPVRVHILVGTGHHTKGSRTPARLPVAVETFLQGEGLKYTKPDPGLLQLVI